MHRFLFIVMLLLFVPVLAADWPMFKGNIYFTGNNDEITVKNSNLKWLFQADERVFNPVVSDGRIYFPDMKGQLYCLDEETGLLIWKINLKDVSAPFAALHKSAGKVKYPLIQGDTLFLSDPVAIYAFNKYTGAVLWARTGMSKDDAPARGLTGYKSLPMVDGIYSDPVILDDRIFYGTRETFHSRNIRNGGEVWFDQRIKSFSAFPVFYDNLLFTQSMDYGKNEFTVFCLDAATGKEIWSVKLQPPVRIFPPVVYRDRVYIPSTTQFYCLNLKNGETIWHKDYKRYITSNPSFTDRSILFSIDNEAIAVMDPENGAITEEIPSGKQSSPVFVTIRDQLYLASNSLGSEGRSYGQVKAVNFTDRSELWNYKTPFPGAVSQPAANGGILFLPCGNYIYAIGALYYPRIVQGGSGNNSVTAPTAQKKDDAMRLDETKKQTEEKIKEREVAVTVKSSDGGKVDAVAEIKKYDANGRLLYSKTDSTSDGKILVPEGDGVEVMFKAPDYIPEKKIINNSDEKIDALLEHIETGKSIVVDNLLFEFNKAYLKKESLNILDTLCAEMKRNLKMKVEVRGFTDNVGDAKYNQRLSERRADAVVEYLVKNGISPERLNSVGLGEKNPIAPNDTPEGRAKNRRTEFLIKSK